MLSLKLGRKWALHQILYSLLVGAFDAVIKNCQSPKRKKDFYSDAN